jgi:hypothetical protein
MLDRCEHPHSEIRRRVQSNGVVAYWRQCLTCFQVVGTAIKRSEAPADCPIFDEEARNRYWEERQVQYEVERDASVERANRDWWRRYSEYLDSDEWRRKRELVLARDLHRCQARLDGCSIHATQVHHLTYRHAFNEPLFDLVAVCLSCHEALHSGGD